VPPASVSRGVLGAIAFAIALCPGRALAATVTVSPLPGTPDASPTTQISILGVPARKIESVRVTGSLSGAHRGRLLAYSGGRGGSYLLSTPLTGAERVRVVVRILGRAPVGDEFTVAHLAPVPPILNIPVLQRAKLDQFASQPGLLPPRIEVYKRSPGLSGDIFLTPLPAPVIHPESNNELTLRPVGPGGPMILDGKGNLVWFHQLPPPTVAANFRPQRFDGREVLTWWQGQVTVTAFGIGEGVIADRSYRTLRTVRTGNGYAADIHEFTITPSGDALFTAYSPILVHLAGTAPGALSPLLDSIVQEVDIRTGLVVWEWHALGHIPLSDSYASPKTSADFDAFHLNSIQALPDNRLLVSARDTSAVYELDRASGRIVWTLGGLASSFTLGRGARFYFQHDAQLLQDDQVSLFDDEAGPPSFSPTSRGLVLKLDPRRRTATVVRSYLRPADTPTDSEGSLQTLPNGDAFVGFGATQYFSEFSPSGRLLFDAGLPSDDGSYRVYRYPWSATPASRPTVVARRTSPGHVSLYVSWNGATTVAHWQVLARRGAGSLSAVAEAPDRGFETRIGVPGAYTTFAVRALAASGRVLAGSELVRAS
jgi:Arylsulfotransferase (ASST)